MKERSLSLVPDDTKDQPSREFLLHQLDAALHRIEQLEREAAIRKTSVTERKLVDRMGEVEDMVTGIAPLLGRVREELYAKRSADLQPLYDAIDRLSNHIQALPQRTEFDVLAQSFRTFKGENT